MSRYVLGFIQIVLISFFTTRQEGFKCQRSPPQITADQLWQSCWYAAVNSAGLAKLMSCQTSFSRKGKVTGSMWRVGLGAFTTKITGCIDPRNQLKDHQAARMPRNFENMLLPLCFELVGNDNTPHSHTDTDTRTHIFSVVHCILYAL